jgi:hypothetical protein
LSWRSWTTSARSLALSSIAASGSTSVVNLGVVEGIRILLSFLNGK